MGRIKDIISLVKRIESTPGQYLRDAGAVRFPGRILWLICIALGFLMVPVAQIQAGPVDDVRVANIDARWNPWIGSWHLVSSNDNTDNQDEANDFHLDVSADDQGTAVTMEAFQGKTVLYADTIVANGISQPLKDKDCSGWYTYSWSDTGKRLLFESESSCPGKTPRNISGLSVIDRNGEWIDIQLMQSQDERIITIRRYAMSADKTEDSVRRGDRATRTTRLSAADFSIDEVIELSTKMPQEVLEAALMELQEPFKVNSKTLMRLADAGVPTPVIDLMVAISFPEKFYIERDTVSIVARSDSSSSRSESSYSYPPYIQYSMVDPFFPWYWTPSTYSLYWNSGWNLWPGDYYRYYSGDGSPGFEERRNSGRLVAGRGYTNVQSRDSYSSSGSAIPRSGDSSTGTSGSYTRSNSRAAPSNNSVSYGSSSSSAAPPPSSSGSSAGYSSSGGSSSGGGSSSSSSSSGSSGSSGGSSPSASPSGYSGGGSSGSAQPR